MARIDRPTIFADIERAACDVGETFGAVVAMLAQRLKFAEQEFIPVATMRLNMVGDDCRCGDPTCEASCAKWKA
jgi:hypothetical protein